MWLLSGVTTQRYRPGQFTSACWSRANRSEVFTRPVVLIVQTSQKRACPRVYMNMNMKTARATVGQPALHWPWPKFPLGQGLISRTLSIHV